MANAHTTAGKPKAVVKRTAHEMEGRKAPPFELSDGGGKTVSLKELLGRGNLVLYFYPKDLTPGCTVEACDFRDTAARLKAAGAQVVGVSADSPDSHRKFTDKHTLNFPLLSDADNRVTRLYGVYKKKSLYGREFMGIERTTFVIDRAGVIRRVFPKVKVAGHANAVVEALKALR
ncbi:MAG TPA: thioredoxin-dependent thiol peroxidase [Candidatus Binataceae bacterium]|jgi:peroxiredoxin Q/BCP|nr:thioredoxin-dependent thiol peroxidase [Candidatus Binataceae bacterium]